LWKILHVRARKIFHDKEIFQESRADRTLVRAAE
jgi:hypothetical protein